MPKIERLPSGTYRVRICLGKDKSGKYRYKSFTSKDKQLLRRKAGMYEDTKDDAPMLCDAVETYISAKSAVLSPYSIRGYKNILQGIKTLSCVNVACDSTAPAFQKIINELADKDKSPKTIKNYAGLISAAVKFAGYPVPAFTLPHREKKESFIPDEKTMKKVLAAAKDTDLEIPIQLGMLGLRRGEVCAVVSDDIAKNILHVHAAAVEIGGKVSYKSPKTFESDRRIQIPDRLAKKIRSQGRATDLTPSMLSDHFFAFLRKNGFQHFRFHDLRHFFVSYCHNVLKLSDAQIQKLGGWRTDYVMKRHYLQSMQDDAAAKKVAVGLGKLF